MDDVKQTFPATLDGLSGATCFLQGYLKEAGCLGKVAAALMVAMDEIASNIVHYSGASDFSLSVSCPDDSVCVVFSDNGRSFDPLGREDPDISLSVEEREIGGLGLLMVKRMMDEVRYVREDDRNVLTIRKKRS